MELTSIQEGEVNLDLFYAFLKKLDSKPYHEILIFHTHITKYDPVEKRFYRDYPENPHHFISPEEEDYLNRDVSLGLVRVFSLATTNQRIRLIWKGVYNATNSHT